MNLQENVDRIRKMMGVIQEDIHNTDKPQIIKKETYENKYGEKITMVQLDNGKVLFKHSDYKNKFVPLDELIVTDMNGNKRFKIILSQDEKEFVNNFLNR